MLEKKVKLKLDVKEKKTNAVKIYLKYRLQNVLHLDHFFISFVLWIKITAYTLISFMQMVACTIWIHVAFRV